MAHPFSRTAISVLALSGWCLGGLATAALADQVSDETTTEKQVDARAVELLSRVNRELVDADTFTADISHALNMRSAAMRQEMVSTFDFAVEKPNRFAMVLKDGMMGETIVSDGETVYTLLPMFNAYTEQEAPKDLQKLFDDLQTASMGMGGGPMAFIAPLISPESFARSVENIRSAEYKGEEQLEGVNTHRLSFVMKPELPEEVIQEMRMEMGIEEDINYIFDAWIEEGEHTVLRKLHFDLTKMMEGMMDEMAEMMPEMRDMTYEMVISFNNWQIGEEIPAERFAFSPPDDAEKVDSFFDAMMAGQPDPNELLGEQAPNFELEMLDGSTLSLDQHRNRDIVILDFWATWCGPCIRAMPTLIEVADEYRDRNVVFYAINLQEENEKVQAMLEERGWDIKVPMDREGSVAEKYKVAGIPQTVIIDTDGTIQAVHVGMAPKQRLTDELDKLLAGEKLAEAPQERPDEY